jgi:hypothetical protein
MLTIFAVTIALFEVIGSVHPSKKRQDNDPWSLYSNGDNINELPIFYADGMYICLFLYK